MKLHCAAIRIFYKGVIGEIYLEYRGGCSLMFRYRTGVLFAALFLFAVGMVDSSVQAQSNGQYVLEGDNVAVYNLVGTLRVEGGRGANVTVKVTLSGGDADEVQIESGSVRGRSTLRVIYPADRIVYSELGRGSTSVLRVRRDGTWGGASGGTRRVTIARTGRGLRAHADIVVTVPEGKKFSGYIGAGEIEAESISGDFLLDTNSGDVSVVGVTGSLVVDTGSGRVTVSDAQADVKIDTGSGRVNLSRVSGDKILVDTGSGRVTGTEISADKLVINTGSGSINIDEVSGRDINLDTGSGSVEIQLLTDVDNMVIDTGSGGVTVRVPSNLSANLEIDVGSGRITIDVPIEYLKKQRTYVRGEIGGGNGHIYIDTGSGSVRIYPY